MYESISSKQDKYNSTYNKTAWDGTDSMQAKLWALWVPTHVQIAQGRNLILLKPDQELTPTENSFSDKNLHAGNGTDGNLHPHECWARSQCWAHPLTAKWKANSWFNPSCSSSTKAQHCLTTAAQNWHGIRKNILLPVYPKSNQQKVTLEHQTLAQSE